MTIGHPDKMADQISDAILDEILRRDAAARVACEVLVTTGLVIISGEISTKCEINFEKVAREKILKIGFDGPEKFFDGRSCAVLQTIDRQSPDISRGVDRGGAGDQGTVFGFACDETPELMPAPILLAHKLTKKMAEMRQKKILDFLLPDGKVQISFEYENFLPRRIDSIVLSAQHFPNFSQQKIFSEIKKKIILPVVENFENSIFNFYKKNKKKFSAKNLLDEKTKFFVNSTGNFVVGGPVGDVGLTGRKIIVDSYGSAARHGGGAFSGKDATKIDRSAAYAARWIAKNLVANKICEKCEIAISYAIGIAEPTAIFVETFGTAKFSAEKIQKIIQKNFDLTPRGIIEKLNLRRPIFSETAKNGHFGHENFSWEKIFKLKI